MTRLEDQKLYIGGRPVDATSGEVFSTINPATGRPLATGHVLTTLRAPIQLESAAHGAAEEATIKRR